MGIICYINLSSVRLLNSDKYDNKALMALLNIKDKYLKKLRDNGYLGYSREGDKYWYTQEDIDRFLRRFQFSDFTSHSDLPPP